MTCARNESKQCNILQMFFEDTFTSVTYFLSFLLSVLLRLSYSQVLVGSAERIFATLMANTKFGLLTSGVSA